MKQRAIKLIKVLLIMCTCISNPGLAEIIVDIIPAVILPILALIIPLGEYFRNIYRTRVDFLSQGNTEDEKNRRKKLYKRFEDKNHKLSEQDFTELDANGDLGKIISFYDMWASMVKIKYLPIKTFKGINGVTAVKLFYILLPYIEYRRNIETKILYEKDFLRNAVTISNETYAKNFEWLVNKIIEKNYVSVDFQKT